MVEALPYRSVLGTLRYEDGKARTGTAVDAGNFRGYLKVPTKTNTTDFRLGVKCRLRVKCSLRMADF